MKQSQSVSLPLSPTPTPTRCMRSLIAALTLSALVVGCSTAATDQTPKDVAGSPTENSAEKQSSDTEPDERNGKDVANTSDEDGESTASDALQPAVPETPIPDASVYPLLAAEFALRERQFDYALTLLSEQALLLDDPEIARRALKLAEFRNNDAAALAMAVRLTELDKSDAAAAATAMSLLIRSGQNERALGFAREAKRRGARINAPALLTNYPELPEAQQQNMQVAFESLATDWPADEDIAIAQALLRREMGDLTGSLEALERVFEQNRYEDRALVLWTQIKNEQEDPKAFDRIASAIEAQPENEQLRLQYARLLATNDDYEGARLQFEALREMSPRNGDYLLSLALIDYEIQDYVAANSHFRELIALGQKVNEAHYYIGRIAEDLLDMDSAILSFNRVGPGREFLDARRRGGALLLDDGNRVGFHQMFDAARRMNPGLAERLFMLEADLLLDREAQADAIEVYGRALSIFPESLALQYGRAMAYEAQEDIAGMERDMRAILEREPDNATTLNALGYSLTQNTERYEEAAELIERALELSPGEAAILDSLGWVYFKLGRLDDAIPPLEAAYAQLPDPEVAAHLGEALWALGRTDEAKNIWQEALTRDPGNSHVTEALRRTGAALD